MRWRCCGPVNRPTTAESTSCSTTSCACLRPCNAPGSPFGSLVAGRTSPRCAAARWDGVIPILPGTESGQMPASADVAALVRYVTDQRAAAGVEDQPFDVVIGGTTISTTWAADHVAGLAEAGATWWDEQRPFDEQVGNLDPVLRRIDQGPPHATPGDTPQGTRHPG